MIPDLKYRVLGQHSVDQQTDMSAQDTTEAEDVPIKREIIDISDSEATDNMNNPENHMHMSASCDMSSIRAASRRPKRLTPDNRKDDNYWQKRKKNNEAARRSREIKRQLDFHTHKRLATYEQENKLLKKELSFLKTTFKLSLDLVYIGIDSDGKFICEPLSKVRSLAMESLEASGYEASGYEQMDFQDVNHSQLKKSTSIDSSTTDVQYHNGSTSNSNCESQYSTDKASEIGSSNSPSLISSHEMRRMSSNNREMNESHYDPSVSPSDRSSSLSRGSSGIIPSSHVDVQQTHYKHYKSASSSESGYEGSTNGSPIGFNGSAFSSDISPLYRNNEYSNCDRYRQQLPEVGVAFKGSFLQKQFTYNRFFTEEHNEHSHNSSTSPTSVASQMLMNRTGKTESLSNNRSSNDTTSISVQQHAKSDLYNSSNPINYHQRHEHYRNHHLQNGKMASLEQHQNNHYLVDTLAKEKVIAYLKQHGIHHYNTYPEDSAGRRDVSPPPQPLAQDTDKANCSSGEDRSAAANDSHNEDLIKKISRLSDEVEMMKKHLSSGLNGCSQK